MHGRRDKEREKKGKRESGDREWLFLPTPSPFKFAPAVKCPDHERISPWDIPPPPGYTVWYNFRILYFSCRITVFLIINYLFNFNLCDGKKLVAFNWELVTLGGCERLRGCFPVLSSLNIVQWPTWRSSEFGRHQKFPPHARKKPPVPRVITGFKWNTTTQPQTKPTFFSQKMVRGLTVACVAWRFWSGAQTSQGGRGQWSGETARRYGQDQLTVQSMFNLWIFGSQDRRLSLANFKIRAVNWSLGHEEW